MHVPAVLKYFELPHHNEQRWKQLKALYAQLERTRSPKDLGTVLERIFRVAGNITSPDLLRSKEALDNDAAASKSNWPFGGLEIFFDEVASEEESGTFFETILPFIASLASSIADIAPKEGVLLCTQQRDTGIYLNRRFIASLLASGFLCALPPVPRGSHVRSINFVNFFACFYREEIKHTQAAKLRCFIHYFKRLHDDWPYIDGRVFFNRQVIPPAHLPTLDDWLSCDLPLCPVVVDHKNSIEDSGEHMLQVDFANRCIGGGVLGGGHVQEEIRFCINPELLVSVTLMEAMEDNEAIVVKGIERFSSYSGYGKTFEFNGDYKDESRRDSNGDIQTTVVAIDAKQFKNATIDAQFEDAALLRELNKALTGFYNADVGCRLIKDATDVDTSASYSESDEFSTGEESSDGKDLLSAQHGAPEIVNDFSKNLVTAAMSEALREFKAGVSVANSADCDILAMVMKKSVQETFGDTPDKARVYSESIVGSSLLPKCVMRKISGSRSPLVPSTPPSSPSACDLERSFTHSNGFQPSHVLNKARLSPAEGALKSLSVKGFADLLSSSLISGVKSTSSVASAIATAASSPEHVAADTRDMFHKSPKKIGSPVKNGEKIISYLAEKVCNVDEQRVAKYSNGFTMSELADDLSTLVSSTKLKRYGEGRGNIMITDGYSKPSNAKQNLTQKLDQIKLEEKVTECKARLDGFDTMTIERVQEFAAELAHSVVNSATKSCATSSEKLNGETDDADFVNLRERIDIVEDALDGISSETVIQNTQQLRDENVLDFIENYVESFLAKTVSLAVMEASEHCENESASVLSSESNEDVNSEQDGKASDDQASSDGSRECSDPENDVINSLESSEDENDDTSFCSMSSVPELVIEESDRLAQTILTEGIKEASLAIEKQERSVIFEEYDAIDAEQAHSEEDEEQCQEFNSSLNDISMEEETLDNFAESLSQLTVCAAVKIAEAHNQARMQESLVRPVATGNWGCGVFRGDPELKAVIQWVVASAVESPAMVYHTFGDQGVSKLLKALRCLHSRDWKVCDVIQGLLRFSNSASEGRDKTDSLLEALCHTPHTSL